VIDRLLNRDVVFLMTSRKYNPMITEPCSYGTFAVAQDCLYQYQATCPGLARAYPLPATLPRKHPVLEQLCTRMVLSDALPPWWQESLKKHSHRCVAEVLSTLTVDEFRQGVIEEQRWRAFKARHAQICAWGWCDQPLPPKPRIALLLLPSWEKWFAVRGSSQTPKQMELVIGSTPDLFINMSNGDSWSSCQHYQHGSLRFRLPGNFFDPGVIMALLHARGDDLWREGAILARTTLRLTCTARGEELVVLGKIYGNNQTCELRMLASLIAWLDQHQIPWGCIRGVNTQKFLVQARYGLKARARFMQGRALRGIETRGLPLSLPPGYLAPYVDGKGVKEESTRILTQFHLPVLRTASVPMQTRVLFEHSTLVGSDTAGSARALGGKKRSTKEE
jgi:hypothetical protein